MADTLNAHEAGFLKFIQPRGAIRVEKLLRGGDKGRDKLRAMMANDIRLNPDYAERIPSNQQFADPVHDLLVGAEAPETCYIICESTEFDGREMALRAAVDQFVSQHFGVFISCIPGKLGYFEYDAVKERYLLKRD